MPAIATIRKRARTRLRQLPTVAMDGLKFRVVVCADIMVLHGATPGMENCVSVGNVAGLGRGGNSVNVLGGWGGAGKQIAGGERGGLQAWHVLWRNICGIAKVVPPRPR